MADLRKELKTRGLNVDGKKSELVERLQQAIGESSLLDENVNDQDEILDEDVVLTVGLRFEIVFLLLLLSSSSLLIFFKI